jgi:hypothetical protein
MADDHHMFNFEVIDCILQHRQEVEVCVDDEIGDIAMHKDFAWSEPCDRIGRYATVCTANPEVFWALLLRQLYEEVGVVLFDVGGPVAVIFN